MKKIQSLLLVSPLVLFSGLEIAQAAHLTGLDRADLPENTVLLAEKVDARFTNKNGTVKEGIALAIDADEVINVPNELKNKLFILNKIYRVQEGTFYDDLFIVDERGAKWQVEQVDSKNQVYLKSGDMSVWALIQQF